jgi:hypothetical protein
MPQRQDACKLSRMPTAMGVGADHLNPFSDPASGARSAPYENLRVLRAFVVSVFLCQFWLGAADYLPSPSTSCMPYSPGFCFASHSAARSAPRAKVSRLWARWMNSNRSPMPRKMTAMLPIIERRVIFFAAAPPGKGHTALVGSTNSRRSY